MKNIVLKTKRLIIRPMTDEELERTAAEAGDPALQAAYGEMLAGCRRDPANRNWYTAWNIAQKASPEVMIGSACFKGPQVRGRVEIGYGMEPGFEGQGYMTEAVKALIEWAVGQEDVYIVLAETDADNTASQHVLEKAGFRPCTGDEAMGEEGPRFRYDRPKSSMLAIYMCLGLSIGPGLGIALGSAALGIPLGLCLGVALGSSLDHSERKHRREITGEEAPPEKK